MISLLLQCNPLLHLLSNLIEDPMYVCGLSEEHPQPVGKVSFLKQLIQGYSENSLEITQITVRSDLYSLK